MYYYTTLLQNITKTFPTILRKVIEFFNEAVESASHLVSIVFWVLLITKQNSPRFLFVQLSKWCGWGVIINGCKVFTTSILKMSLEQCLFALVFERELHINSINGHCCVVLPDISAIYSCFRFGVPIILFTGTLSATIKSKKTTWLANDSGFLFSALHVEAVLLSGTVIVFSDFFAAQRAVETSGSTRDKAQLQYLNTFGYIVKAEVVDKNSGSEKA